MDFWPSAGGPLSPNGAGSDLNLLNDSLLIDLDDKTLQCLMGGPTAGFGTCFSGGGSGECADGEAVASGSNKREAEAAADEGDDDESDGGGRGGRGGGRSKKTKVAADAASVKACREKARREKLNECFDELARLCDPTGKMSRTDRISVVQDAIRAMGALRVEVNQLRQLNKFLEERVRHHESARAQNMYQHAMLAQQQQLALAQQQAAAHAAAVQQQAAQGGAAPCPAQQQQQQQQQQDPAAGPSGQSEIEPASGAGMLPVGAALLSSMPSSSALTPAPGMMLVQVPIPAVGAAPGGQPAYSAPQPFYTVKAEGLVPALGSGGVALAAGAGSDGLPQVMPANAPPLSWLPPPDVSQDQKLRPPAA